MQSPLRHPIAVVLWLMVALLASPPVHAASSTDSIAFDKAVDDAIARYHLPGIAVGVITDGEVVYMRTAGERIAGSGEPITTETLFKIASNSKAMTASVLARLVQAGKLRWDDPVVKYLPDFAMHDPWVTRNMQVRDLLVHNSGLPEGGGDLMLWPEPNAFTRADIIHGLRYIKPAYGFRSGYAYDNLLYVVAGEVAAAAGGAPYEELVRREVFAPLGLARCRVGQFDRDQVSNVAQPHMRKDGRNVVLNEDEAVVPAITSAAAGGIRCSLTDMLAWARNWLAPSGQQLQWLSSNHRREMWAPRTPMPISQRRRDWDRTHYYAYALGFRVADADGAWTVSHTGTLSGMYSAMMLLPDSKSGFVLMINGDGDAARTVLTQVLLKHFTAPDDGRPVAFYADALAESKTTVSSALAAAPAGVAAVPADMATWLGAYRDPWFGDVSICPAGDGVRFRSKKSPLLSGRVMRVAQRYLVDWDGDSVDTDAWLTFSGGTEETTLKMAKFDPDADFSSDFEDLAFTRVRRCE